MKEPCMTDTMIACCGSLGYFLPYMRGEYAPHYPMPAVRYVADWFITRMPSVVIFRIETDDDYELPEIVFRFYC